MFRQPLSWFCLFWRFPFFVSAFSMRKCLITLSQLWNEHFVYIIFHQGEKLVAYLPKYRLNANVHVQSCHTLSVTIQRIKQWRGKVILITDCYKLLIALCFNFKPWINYCWTFCFFLKINWLLVYRFVDYAIWSRVSWYKSNLHHDILPFFFIAMTN